ncbi:MAG: hypothetical protein KIS67_28835 [Verrucomicrobiae bacterium]|nr:hypothetical protein [Verrucomicrobiae bacterium]
MKCCHQRPQHPRPNNSGSADRRFVWGLRSVDDLILRDDTSLRLYALSDAMGSVTAVVNTSATVQERYGYDGFGAPRYMDGSFGSRGSSSYAWETLFDGYRYDLESGLYQVRYRYLHPKLGRWPNRDPINELGFNLLIRGQNPFNIEEEKNLYAFVRNNPVSFLDFLGLKKQVTGVKWCAGGKHQWIEYPGGSAGYYPKNDTIGNCIWGPGQVVNPDPHVGDEDKKCTDIKLDTSCYDLDKFKTCVEKKSQPKTGGTPYSVFGYNCANWVATVIKNCKEEAKK